MFCIELVSKTYRCECGPARPHGGPLRVLSAARACRMQPKAISSVCIIIVCAASSLRSEGHKASESWPREAHAGRETKVSVGVSRGHILMRLSSPVWCLRVACPRGEAGRAIPASLCVPIMTARFV